MFSQLKLTLSVHIVQLNVNKKCFVYVEGRHCISRMS